MLPLVMPAEKPMQYVLSGLYRTIWDTEVVPGEWHPVIIIPLYKGKCSP